MLKLDLKSDTPATQPVDSELSLAILQVVGIGVLRERASSSMELMSVTPAGPCLPCACAAVPFNQRGN